MTQLIDHSRGHLEESFVSINAAIEIEAERGLMDFPVPHFL
ncbi:hypothetical protein [Pseudooceanicola nitratireducens]|nr:hypothetical protein [Pseudooceanicola nitratireducens]